MGQMFPWDAGIEDEQNAEQRLPVANARTTAFRTTTRLSRHQRLDLQPQIIR